MRWDKAIRINMSNQHHTINSPRAAKQNCLAARRLPGVHRLPCVFSPVLTLIMLIFILSAGVATTAIADGAQRSRAQAVQIAKSRSGNGRVLSVNKRIDKNGNSVFAVKIIVNGRVKVYAIPEFAR